ncbi:unnamed protein product [Strongylus vulgaris]|uniref:Histidine ammonia-lyase n=1 Tax=Strongylus vulgaris TaxID=40348 RepID=A0A3P7JJW1_STRVU|nr:unnamed protein product [Strongylus vulgaris]
MRKLRSSMVKLPGGKEYEEVRRIIGNSLIDPDDKAGDVLKDGDFVIIGTEYLSDLATNEVQIIHRDETEEEKERRRLNDLESTRIALEKLDKPRKIKFDFDPSPEVPLMDKPTKLLVLDGASLTPADLVKCERGECVLQLSTDAEERVRKGRALLEKIATEHRGKLNLIRSHATAYGQPLHPSKARMLLALRINVLAKGYSGISLENLKKMIAAFNAFCVSYVPQQGTVGCSGDLAPLAHLALGLLGEGKMWSPSTG